MADRRAEECDHVLEAFERLLEVNERRERSQVEVPFERTLPFIRLAFAYAFAALGDPAWAEKFREQAQAELVDDDVSQTIAAFYVQRIEDATAGRSPDQLVPEALCEAVATNRFHRYKIERTLAETLIGRGIEPVLDPVQGYQTQQWPPHFRALSTAELDELDIARLPGLPAVASAASEISRMSFPLEASHTILAHLHVAPVAVRIHTIDAVWASCDERGVQDAAFAHAVEGIRRASVVRARSSLTDLERWALACVRWVQRLQAAGAPDLAEELAMALWDRIDPARGDLGTRATAQSAWGACVVALRGYESTTEPDPSQADEPRVEEILGDVRTMSRNHTILALRTLYGLAPPEDTHAHALRLINNVFPSITDAWNLNSHVCLSVLSFAEAIALTYVARYRDWSVLPRAAPDPYSA